MALTQRPAPDGLRWANGGGSPIGECNGLHLARKDVRGTQCGRYGPHDTTALVGNRICGNCARIAGIPRIVA